MKLQLAAYQKYLLRSIYGNALDQPNSMDLCALFMEQGIYTQPLIRQLLDAPSLTLDVEAEDSVGLQIKALSFEAANRHLLHSEQSLCIGYPFFARADAGGKDGYLCAPVFLWQVQVQPNQQEEGKYKIMRTFHQQVRPNPLLMQYLEKHGIEKKQLNLLYEVCKGGKINAEKLLSAVNQLCLTIGSDTFSNAYQVQSFPSATELNEINNASGRVFWSGVLGVFPTQSFASVALLEHLGDDSHPFANAVHESASPLVHSFGASATLNVRQAAVLRHLPIHRNLVVYAPNGTGKTELINAILTNALANGAKCLVVSSLSSTINATKINLDKQGLSDLVLKLQSPAEDKTNLITALQRAVGSAKTPVAFPEADYQLALSGATRAQNKLDQTFQAINQPLMGDASWTELVGRFLQNQYTEGKHVLNGYISPNSWTFNEGVHVSSLQIVTQSKALYRELGTLTHPLNAIHPSVFVARTNQDAFDFIHNTNTNFMREAKALHRNINRTIEEYADALEAYYYRYYLNLGRESAALREEMSDYKTQFGNDFDKQGILKNAELWLKGIFSSRHKGILEVRQEVGLRHERLIEQYNRRPYFQYSPNKNSKKAGFERVANELQVFHENLSAWKDRLPSIVREEAARVAATNHKKEVELTHEIEQFDAQFHALIAAINTSGYLAKPFDTTASTLPQQKQYLETILQQTQEIERNLRDFDPFYAWQNHWLVLPDHLKEAVAALVRTNSKNWEAAFSSWFINQSLSQQPHELLQEDSDMLDRYERALTKVTDFIPAKILHVWGNRQNEQVKRLRNKNRILYQELSNTKDNAALQSRTVEELIGADYDLLTEVFPVLLVSPQIATECLPALAAHFDIVIIDDADRQQLGNTFGALWRATHRVVIAENDVSDTDTSLWSWVKREGFFRIELTQLYYKTNPKFSRLSNALFHEHRLEVVPTNIDVLQTDAIMKLMQVNGIYYPEHRTNEDEAQEVIKLLNDVKPNAYQVFPSVAIVCFTFEQRNLIADYLQKIKQQKQAGYDRILQLEKCGLGVFHISELEGVNKDVVLVSVTYGLDYRRYLSTDIDEVRQAVFTNYLQMLVATPNAITRICSSVPFEFIEAQLKRPNTDALQALCIYLAYAEAVEEGNETRQNELVARAHRVPAATEYVVAPSLNEQVKNELGKYLDPEMIKINQWVDNIPVDILIQADTANGTPVAIITDGFFSRGKYQTFERESAYIQRLEAKGYRYYPLYTRLWWKQPSLEARKLAGSFIKNEANNVETGAIVAN